MWGGIAMTNVPGTALARREQRARLKGIKHTLMLRRLNKALALGSATGSQTEKLIDDLWRTQLATAAVEDAIKALPTNYTLNNVS
jgi:hypothetical protein